MKMIKLLLTAGMVLTLGFGSVAYAAGDAVALPKQDWSHKGMTGTFDKPALQRGFQVYKEVCAACHSLKYVAYRNLADLGYDENQIKAVAAEYTVKDGPNDEGEMFDRPALPADKFVPPFPNEKAARAANNGAFPPDLSLMIKARKGGEDYMYNLLVGYTSAPEGFEMMPGMSYNKYFAGHQIAMVPPLAEGVVSYADGTDATVEQMAKDVTQFLAWTAEPHLEKRKRMGWKVLLFLLAFAVVMYASKKKVWSNLEQ